MSKLNVLLVDDDPVQLAFLSGELCSGDHEIISADELGKGITIVTQNMRARLHAAIIDFYLSDGNPPDTSVLLFKMLRDTDPVGYAQMRFALRSSLPRTSLVSHFAAEDVPFPAQFFQKIPREDFGAIKQWLGALPKREESAE